MVDKTGDLKNAEDVLEKLKQKEKSRKARDDVLWRLQSARAVGDVAAMEAMISGWYLQLRVYHRHWVESAVGYDNVLFGCV